MKKIKNKLSFSVFTAVVIIFLSALALRLYQPLSTGHIVGLDGYYHMRIAEFYKAGNFNNFLLYPPGTQLLIAAFSMAAGISAEFSTMLLSSFFSALAVVAVFLLASQMFGKKPGIYSALFMAFSAALVLYGSRGKNLNFALPLLLIGLWLNGSGKTRHFAAVCMVLAVFSPADAAVLAALALLSAYFSGESRKAYKIGVLVPALLLLFSLLVASIYLNPSFSEIYFTKAIPAGLGKDIFFLPSAGDFLVSLSPLLILFGIFGIVLSHKKNPVLAFACLLLLISFPFHIIETDRWYVYASALLALFAGYGINTFGARLKRFTSPNTIQMLLSATIILTGIVFIYWTLPGNSWGIMNSQRYSAYEWLRYNTPENSVVLATISESHWIFGISQRTPFTTANLIQDSGVSENYDNTKIIYTTNNSQERVALLEKYNISYIVISDKTYWHFGDVRSSFNSSDFQLVYQDEPYEIFTLKI